MTATTRRPQYIPLIRKFELEKINCISDDIIYKEERSGDIFWAFYDDFVRLSEQTNNRVRIPIERTSAHIDPLDYWKWILRGFNNDAHVIISVPANSSTAANVLPGIDPNWLSLDIEYLNGVRETANVQFSSDNYHNYFFELPGKEVITKATNFFNETLQNRLSVFIAGPVKSPEIRPNDLLSLVIDKIDEDSTSYVSINCFDKLEYTVEGDTTVHVIDKDCGNYAVIAGTEESVMNLLEFVKSHLNADHCKILWCSDEKEFEVDDIDACGTPSPPRSARIIDLMTIPARFFMCRWKYQHGVLLDICIALANLELPPYVILWIGDFVEYLEWQSHLKKIRLIESVRSSIWSVQEKRLQLADGPISRRTRRKQFSWAVAKETSKEK